MPTNERSIRDLALIGAVLNRRLGRSIGSTTTPRSRSTLTIRSAHMPTHPPTATVATPKARTMPTGLTALWKGQSPAAAADAVWVPLVSGALILAVGAMSLATKSPWLFAGLGPTAVMIAASPGHTTTRFHSIVLGHAVAFVCAWLAVMLVGASGSPALLSAQSMPVARVWASAIAVAVTALVQPSLKAYHPPAAATALLVTLGVYRLNWKTSLSLLAGVVLVGLLGEWFQRIRIAEQQRAKSRA
jgi:CBS-domain-containing membrane protein